MSPVAMLPFGLQTPGALVRRRAAALLTACVVLLQAHFAAAQPRESFGAGPLSGVLKHIKAAGVVRIGYRESSVPFSFSRPGGEPNGYSIELCQAIVEEITAALSGRRVRVEYRQITPENRIDEVAAGSIDLECGSTTNTAERRKRVAFSPVIFVTGTRLAVRRGSPVRTFRDLGGRTVVLARGTTNEAAMRELLNKNKLKATVITATDLAEAFTMLAAGKADALASDDILLYGYLAEKGLRAQYNVVGNLLSYEPYGIMYARDDRALADAVTAAFTRLATTGELRRIYNQSFLRGLPSGVRIDLPMSQPLRHSFELLGLPSE